ncbi:MAG: hypothetical protein NTV68_16145 [Methanomicrobiales archaeon]|nr:hypothetical protein [Methanomicrobiales archaeon]
MKKYCLIIFAVLLLLVLVHGVAALSVTVEPKQIEHGGPVTISIQGLEENSTVSLQLEGRFAMSPEGGFSYETDNLFLPFTLKDGTLSATMQNTDENSLSIRKDDTEVKRVGISTNGKYSVKQSGTIPSGKYNYIILSGTAAPGAQEVIAAISLQGTKQGPSDSKITFSTTGTTDGTVAIRISVNGVQALSDTIRIGNPGATPTYTPRPTRTTSYGSLGGGGGGGGGFGAIVESTSPTPTPVVNVTPVKEQPTPRITMAEPALSTSRAPDKPDTPAPPVQSTAVPQTPTPTKAGFPLVPVIISLSLALFLISRRGIR